MDIFESLENLNVSEECFDDIMDIVEELLSEGTHLAGVVDRYAKKRGYLVPNYIELRDKALALPGTNDSSSKKDKDGKWTIDLQGDTDKNKSNDERGQEKNDKRHVEFGRSKEELRDNREKDEEKNFVKASVKSALRSRSK